MKIPFHCGVRRFAVVFCFACVFVSSAPSQSAPDNFDSLTKDATAARERNDVPAAIELYTRAVAIKPEWPDGWWFLGMLRYGSADYAAAREALTHFIALTPQAGPALAVRGLCEFELGDYKPALADIRGGLALGAATQTQNEGVLRYHEALLFTLNKQYENALLDYSFLAQGLGPSGRPDPEMLTGIGLAGLRMALLPREVSSDERERLLATGLAAFHFMSGDEARAQSEFGQLFKQFPGAVNEHYFYGYLLFAKDQEAATAEFKRELEIAPANASANVMLAWGLLLRNDFAAALPFAQKAVAETPASSTAQLVLGRAMLETGDASGGLTHLESAVKIDPDNVEIHIALAKAYSESGRKDDAWRERLLCLDMTKGEAPVARP